MAPVQITAVKVCDNPAQFTSPLRFEIQYQCYQDLANDLEWKLTYVGSATEHTLDQVLDTVLVGPVKQGTFAFTFEADPPDYSLIPQDDIIGVTVVLLTCSYNQQEFVRVGYYVNNEYIDEELRENPPETLQIARLQRNILADKPRVTRFQFLTDEEYMAQQYQQKIAQQQPGQQQQSMPFQNTNPMGEPNQYINPPNPLQATNPMVTTGDAMEM